MKWWSFTVQYNGTSSKILLPESIIMSQKSQPGVETTFRKICKQQVRRLCSGEGHIFFLICELNARRAKRKSREVSNYFFPSSFLLAQEILFHFKTCACYCFCWINESNDKMSLMSFQDSLWLSGAGKDLNFPWNASVSITWWYYTVPLCQAYPGPLTKILF